jgi:hypothetical protein
MPGGAMPGGAMPGGAPSGPAAGGSAKATIVIHVPHHKHRRAKFVSPSTQSAAITIDPKAGCTTCSPALARYVNLSQNSPSCTTSSAGQTCTVSLVLAPGAYVATVSTYDGPVAAGFPTGNLLALNGGIVITIAAGKANVPSITLDGVPAGVTFFNLGQNLVISGNAFFRMVGPSSHALFQVYATDPDGNVIIGPGAPTFTATPGGGFKATVTGNTVQLDSPAKMSAGLWQFAFTATSPACSAAGALCQYGEVVSFNPIAAVANPGTNSVVMIVSSTNLQYATVASGISNPTDVKFDASGDLFVANKGTSTVALYAPPYTGAAYQTIATGIAQPSAMAISSDGKYLAVANDGNSTTTVYSAPSYASPVTINLPTSALTFDSADNLWVAVPVGSGAIVRYPSPFATSNLTLTSGVNGPTALAIDPQNSDLLVGNSLGNTITLYSAPSYGGVPASVGTPAGVVSMAELNGGLFVACYSGGGQSYTDILFPENTYSTGTTPCHPAHDQAGVLWLSVPDASEVEQYQGSGGTGIPLSFSTGLTDPGAIAAFP